MRTLATPKQPLRQLRKCAAMNIHRRRRYLQLTKEQCACRAGVSLRHWKLYENGRGQIALHTLLNISFALQMQPHELLQ